MTMTEDFLRDPKDFLASHTMICSIQDQADKGGTRNENLTRKFELVPHPHSDKIAVLQFKVPESGTSIEAYWLPWMSHHATAIQLGDKADFFFTSQLTGCRMSVITENQKAPLLIHTAGDINSPAKRTEQEIVDGIIDPSNNPPTRARSLSVSDGRIGKPGKLHDYRGQLHNKSSAFVYGIRDKDGGFWYFLAQIADGFSEEVMIMEDLEQLHQVHMSRETKGFSGLEKERKWALPKRW